MSASPSGWTKIREETCDKLRNALKRTNQPHKAQDIESILFTNCKKSVEKYKEAVDQFLERPALNKPSGKSKSIIALQSLTDNLNENMSSQAQQPRFSKVLPTESNQARSEVHQQAPNNRESMSSIAPHALQSQYINVLPTESNQTRSQVHHQQAANNHGMMNRPLQSWLQSTGTFQGPENTNNTLAARDSAVVRPAQRIPFNQAGAVQENLLTASSSGGGATVQSDSMRNANVTPAAESLLLLQNSVDLASTTVNADSSSTHITSLRFKSGPLVQKLTMGRLGKNLVATWSPPDLSSLPLTHDIVTKLLETITYHVLVFCYGYSPPWLLNEPFSSSTKQCCYLISPDSPIKDYEVKVSWSVLELDLFESIPQATSNRRSLYENTGITTHIDCSIYADKESPMGDSLKVYKGQTELHYEACVVTYMKKKKSENWRQLLGLRHTNIARCLGAGNNIKSFVVAVELCQSLTMESVMKENKLSLSDRRIASLQILLGLKYLHDKGIGYDDLHPRNILFSLSGRNIKLAYYGISDKVTEGFVGEVPTIFDLKCARRIVQFMFSGSDFTSDTRHCETCDCDEDAFPSRFQSTYFESEDFEFFLSEEDLSYAVCHPFFWREERLQQYLKMLSAQLKDQSCKKYIPEECERLLSAKDLGENISSEQYSAIRLSHFRMHQEWDKIIEDRDVGCEVIASVSNYFLPAPYRCLSGAFTSSSRKRRHSDSSDQESL